ncbi:hypothetical protein [Candidatus Enterovibrio altilux]|nr:hypothetical protein [Candidatus Enterovibrio luxaltus]
MKCYLTYFNRPVEVSMKYKPTVLTTPNNVTKPFVLKKFFEGTLSLRDHNAKINKTYA